MKLLQLMETMLCWSRLYLYKEQTEHQLKKNAVSRVQQNRKKLRMTGAKTYEGTHATKKIIKKNLEK